MVLALAQNVEVIHGRSRMSRQPPAPAMGIVRIRVSAVKRNPRRSIPAVTATVMARGSSIRPVSIGAPVLAGIAVQRIMTTLRTA